MIDTFRRNLILASIGATLIPRISRGSDDAITLFVSESGVVNNLSPFVTGVLVCTDVDSLEKDLNEKREELDYQLEVSYHSTNRFKLEFAKLLIATVLNHDAVQLKVSVLPAKKNVTWPDKKADLATVYAEHQRLRMDKTIRFANTPVDIKLERHSRGLRDKTLQDRIVYKHGNQVSVKFIKSQEYNLFQACDLITGSIFGALEGVVKNKTKTELIDYLLSELEIKSDSLCSYVKKKNIEISHVDKA